MDSIFENPFEKATDKFDEEKYNKLLDRFLSIDASILKEIPLQIKKFQLIDIVHNHYKFYHISLLENGYIVHYGRIDTKGSIYDSRIKKGVMSKAHALGEFKEKCLEKVSKGYREIS